MIEKYVIVGGVIVVGAVLYAVIRYLNRQKDSGLNVERAYTDELHMGEVKKWFDSKLISDNYQGILFDPSSENVKKWNVPLDGENANMLIQAVYDMENDELVQYREISFDVLSEKLRALLDENDGWLVIQK